MAERKKPDNVVFNEEIQKYDPSLKRYGTNLGAPAIVIEDATAWKKRSVSKLNHKVKARYLELKLAYDKMMNQFEYNKLIFNAKFSFEPVIGDVYHLYEKSHGETFLSLIHPKECSFNFIGSYYLNTEQIWEKVLDED